MSVLVLIVFFLLAGIYHQALYILIPVISVYHLTNREPPKLVLNPVLKLYLTVVLVVTLFVLIQSLLNQNIYWFSIKGTARYLTYFLFGALVFSFGERQLSLCFRALILLLVISFPLGIYQVFEPVVYKMLNPFGHRHLLASEPGRYQSVFQHANHLAYVLDICIYYVIFHKPFAKKGIKILVLTVLLISLALTKSSGGILVLVSILGFNIFLSKRISFSTKTVFLLSMVLVSFLVLRFSEKVALQLESLKYLNREFLEQRVEEFTPGGYGSVVWRIVYWIKILISFMEEPFRRIVFGIGVDHLTKGNMPYPYMYKDPHNDFLKVLVEFGVTGLLLFLGFFRRLYTVTFRNFNLIILIVIPMFFGNAIVNFPFNLAFILLLAYEYKKHTALVD